MNLVLIKLIPIGKLKHKLMEKYYPYEKSIVIKQQTKCLVVGPHPDDETIGCGGMMLKYTNNFDCVVMSSSGTPNDIGETIQQNANTRIQEFKSVMKKNRDS